MHEEGTFMNTTALDSPSPHGKHVTDAITGFSNQGIALTQVPREPVDSCGVERNRSPAILSSYYCP